MVNFFIYAKDFSGSTEGSKYYHTNGLQTLQQFKKDVEKIEQELLSTGEPLTESKIIYLHWGYTCEEVDEDTTRKAYLEQDGTHRDTIPQVIIHWLQHNSDVCCENSIIRLLYIITDGLIDERSTEECFQLNEQMRYEKVVFHAFNQDPTEINLSVAASFFKKRCVAYCNNKLHDDVDIQDTFDYDKINIDNFGSEKDNLKSYIKLKFLKRFEQDARALEEVEKLKKLRARLLKTLPSTTHEKGKINLETKDKSAFLRDFVRTGWYKNLVSPQATRVEVEVEKSISTLINYIVSETKSYSFDALKFDTQFNESVEEEPVMNIHFKDEEKIVFPDIILDDDKGIPVVILTESDMLRKIIFHRKRRRVERTPASFSKFKSTMECPLFLLNDKGISESIGYFYTYNVYRQFLASNIKNEPRTRKPFHGGLVLTDLNQFDKYNDYILSATYFNSKKVNFNIGLFYYVLWKNCENKEWMDRNVVEQFKKYAMRRIRQTFCKIGLSSLPLDPKQKTWLPTALWYCLELSSCIFKDDPQNYTQERLRMFYGVAHCMIEILQYFDYDLDLESIEKRRDLIRHAMVLKKVQKRRDKAYFVLENIFKTVNGFLVSEIEKPFNLYKLNYLKLNHKKMLRDDVVEKTVHLNDYVHLMNLEGDSEYSKAGKDSVEICEKTFRPFFTVDESNSFYSELLNNTRKTVISDDDDKNKIKLSFELTDSLDFDRILSRYSLFIHCVEDLGKYPTLIEFVEYILKRKKFHGNLVTIFPTNIYTGIKDVYNCYQKVVTKVAVSKFIEVCKTYVNRTERIKAEGRVKFDCEESIKKFISNEESKVNLKKNM